jgi:DNA-binding transcriptional regulator YdaS (Cro superfamily)
MMDKLYDYLHSTMRDETAYQRYERFAEQLGVTMFAVRKWVYNQRRVPDEMKIRIQKITNGKVTIEDLVKAGYE